MRAFITGATGFIGRRLVDQLSRAGVAVTALTRSRTPNLPSRIATLQGDIRAEPALTARLLEGHDILFHLAALVSFDPDHAARLTETNAEGARRILAAARLARVPRVLVVSSACTIGLSRNPSEVLNESSPFDPKLRKLNPYLASKLDAENFALQAASAGQSVTIVNPTTVFGPGDDSLNSGTLVRQVAQAKLLPIPPGGSNVVDVDDLVEGILAAARRGRSGARYILGGANLRFAEIIREIAATIGRSPLLIPLPRAAKPAMKAAAWLIHRATRSRIITPQIIADSFAYKFYSSDLARLDLGWKPQRRFTDTLAAAWNYYTKAGLIPAGNAA